MAPSRCPESPPGGVHMERDELCVCGHARRCTEPTAALVGGLIQTQRKLIACGANARCSSAKICWSPPLGRTRGFLRSRKRR